MQLRRHYNGLFNQLSPFNKSLISIYSFPVTFQVASFFAANGNWEDQEVYIWASVLFLDRKCLLIFPNESHLFPFDTSKCYPRSNLVWPSYDKNVNIIIAILLLYFILILVFLHCRACWVGLHWCLESNSISASC